MRHLTIVAALALVQGCAPEPPLSNARHADYAQDRLDQRIGHMPVSTEIVTTQPLGAPLPGAGTAGAAGASTAGLAYTGGTSTGGGGPDAARTAGVQASPANAAPTIANGTGLSDEQSFAAVSSRETIESDAERRAAQAAAYQVVQPGALPSRSADAGPNIVAYALQTTNQRGQRLYTRFLGSQSRMARNCAKYASPDAAQRAFLASGGPQRDRQGLDPDGDGFACAWDPTPFRQAAGR